jgi:hypothetical protein
MHLDGKMKISQRQTIILGGLAVILAMIGIGLIVVSFRGSAERTTIAPPQVVTPKSMATAQQLSQSGAVSVATSAFTPIPTLVPTLEHATASLATLTVTPGKPVLDANMLSMLTRPLTIRLSEADMLMINLPAPTSMPPTVVPPASEHTPSPAARCPSPGNPVISINDIGTSIGIQAYLTGGGDVADLEKLLNTRLSIQDGYMPGSSNGRAYHVDVTGDSVPDVLVARQGINRSGEIVLLDLFYCNNGRYKVQNVLVAGGYIFGEPDLGVLSISRTSMGMECPKLSLPIIWLGTNSEDRFRRLNGMESRCCLGERAHCRTTLCRHARQAMSRCARHASNR